MTLTQIMSLMMQQTSERVAISRDIDALGQLEEGWRYGEGEQISKDVCQWAKVVAFFGVDRGLHVSAFPSIGGEIILRFHHFGYTLEVYVNGDGSFDTRLEYGRGFDFNIVGNPKEDIAFYELAELIEDLAWNTSAPYTQATMTIQTDDSRQRFSPDPRVMKRAFLFSIVSAQSLNRDRYVNTLDSITVV